MLKALSAVKTESFYLGITEKNAIALDAVLSELPSEIREGVRKCLKRNNKNKRNSVATAITRQLNKLRSIIDFEMINANKHEIKKASETVSEEFVRLQKNHSDLSCTELINLFYKTNISKCVPKIDSTNIEFKNETMTLTLTEFWKRKLTNATRRNRELIAFRLGLIGKKETLYCTNATVRELKQSVLSKEYFNRNIVIANKLTAEYVHINNATSQQSQLYSETLCYLNGLNKYAIRHELSAALITITAPADMHMKKQKGKLYSPIDVHKKIQSQWKKYSDNTYQWVDDNFYFRIVEPHKDGTPHWHVMIFFPKKKLAHHKKALLSAFEIESFKGTEILDWKNLDLHKNDAIGYLLEKVQKGFEKSSQIKYDNNAARRAAYIQLWNFKGQEFIGLPVNTKTLWRQLRSHTYSTKFNNPLDQMQEKAKANEFCDFLELFLKHKEDIEIIRIKSANKKSKTVIGLKWGNKEFLASESNYNKMHEDEAESALREESIEPTLNSPISAIEEINETPSEESTLPELNNVLLNQASTTPDIEKNVFQELLSLPTCNDESFRQSITPPKLKRESFLSSLLGKITKKAKHFARALIRIARLI